MAASLPAQEKPLCCYPGEGMSRKKGLVAFNLGSKCLLKNFVWQVISLDRLYLACKSSYLNVYL